MRCSRQTATQGSLLLGFLIVSLVGGCCERTLEVPQHTFASPDEAFWAYQKAARERDYAAVFSYLSVDQRDAVGELFWWLQRYTQNGEETLRALGSLEALPVGERYVAGFAIAGIGPLHRESVAVENLRRDAVRMKWDGSRRCYVFEYVVSLPHMWIEDPHIEVITERNGRNAIRLNYLWTGTDRDGICIRRKNIEACQDAIRAQDRLTNPQNRTP